MKEYVALVVLVLTLFAMSELVWAIVEWAAATSAVAGVGAVVLLIPLNLLAAYGLGLLLARWSRED